MRADPAVRPGAEPARRRDVSYTVAPWEPRCAVEGFGDKCLMNADRAMHRRQLLGMLGGSAVLAAGWGAPMPAVRVKGCEQQWIRPLSDTEFLSFDSLVSYYCDFESDLVMREFDNPFTGENRWPDEFIRPPAGSKLTMFARSADLADPDLTRVPANFAGHVLMPFFPWMEMADRPGHLLWHVQGYKITSLDELDEDYLAAARADLGDRFERSPEFDSEPSRFARRLKAMGRLP